MVCHAPTTKRVVVKHATRSALIYAKWALGSAPKELRVFKVKHRQQSCQGRGAHAARFLLRMRGSSQYLPLLPFTQIRRLTERMPKA